MRDSPGMQSVRTGKAPRRSSGPYSVRDALNREKPVLSRAKNSTRARGSGRLGPGLARPPIRSCIRVRPRMSGSIAERKGQGRRRAARRVAVAACAGCALLTCLSEHFPRNRGTRRRYSLHTTPVHGGKYGYFVRFFARLAPAERRASAVGVAASHLLDTRSGSRSVGVSPVHSRLRRYPPANPFHREV